MAFDFMINADVFNGYDQIVSGAPACAFEKKTATTKTKKTTA